MSHVDSHGFKRPRARNAIGATALALLLGVGCAANSFAADTPGNSGASSGSQPLPDTITLCSSLSNPPREFVEQGKPAGSDVELATAMADSLGLKIKWLQLHFASLVSGLQAGQCDMIVNELFITDARKKVIDFVPYSVSGEQIVVRKDSKKNIEGMDDLYGLKVALSEGTTFMRLVEAANEKRKAGGKTLIKTLIVPSTHDTFNYVASGMADAAGATTTSAAYYIGKSDGALIRAGKPFHSITDGFGFRKGSTTLRNAMQKAFDQAVKSGLYAKIFAKYGLESAKLPDNKDN